MIGLLAAAMAVSAAAEDIFHEFNIKPRLSIPPHSPDCFTDRDLLLADNTLPGPTIRTNVGDTVHITWHNNHPSEGVSIHYHGLLMKDYPYMDGAGGITTCVVGPMQSFKHEFVADNAGTHYWHGHTSMDRMDGLQGLIIVEDPNDPEEQALKELYDEERVLWLQDWYHKSGPSLRTSLDSGVWIGTPKSILVNGKGRFQGCVDNPELSQCDEGGCSVQDYVPSIPVEEGKTYLFRIINAGTIASVNLAMANHTMSVVKADGTFVDPFDVTSLEVNIAQRYSVLVKADQPSDESYWVAADGRRSGMGYTYLHYKNSTPPNENSTMPVHDMMGPELDAKLVSKDPQDDLLAADVIPDRSSVIVTAQSTYPPLKQDLWTSNNVSMSLHSPKPLAALAYEAVNDEMAADWPKTQIPGTVLVPDFPPSVWNYGNKPRDEGVSGVHEKHGLAVFQYELGDVVDMVFQNTVGNRGIAVKHAWHLHGHEVYVVGQGTGTFDAAVHKDTFNYDNPVLRDTFSVWDFGWTAIRFRASNVGVFPFHCTMTPHAVMGMGFSIITSPDLLPAPPPGLTSCTMTSMHPDDAQVCMSKVEATVVNNTVDGDGDAKPENNDGLFDVPSPIEDTTVGGEDIPEPAEEEEAEETEAGETEASSATSVEWSHAAITILFSKVLVVMFGSWE